MFRKECSCIAFGMPITDKDFLGEDRTWLDLYSPDFVAIPCRCITLFTRIYFMDEPCSNYSERTSDSPFRVTRLSVCVVFLCDRSITWVGQSELRTYRGHRQCLETCSWLKSLTLALFLVMNGDSVESLTVKMVVDSWPITSLPQAKLFGILMASTHHPATSQAIVKSICS